MPIAVFDGAADRAVSAVSVYDGAADRDILIGTWDDGYTSHDIFRAAGAAIPEVADLAMMVDGAARNYIVGAGAGQVAVSFTGPAGSTLALHGAGGRNIPATTPGRFVFAAPASTETFTASVTNQAGETASRQITFWRAINPVWGALAVTRNPLESGPSGALLIDGYDLAAPITSTPRPVVTLEGDSYFTARAILGGIDLTTGRHLTADPDTAGLWRLTINGVSIRRPAGQAFDQTIRLRATNALTGVTADIEHRWQIGGSRG